MGTLRCPMARVPRLKKERVSLMSVIAKPKVFISSTIHDFQDLRSALRYWLSELGFEVLLSEFNDFPKKLDENSYQSCLNAIAGADYFVLLVGARTGGWFDENSRISITRKEYREARERFLKTGRPKLAIFVRQNLWDVREDRNELRKYLVQDLASLRELTPGAREELASHSSRFVNDAQTTFEFLSEIGQVGVMREAAKGEAEPPKGNWIHRFSDFSDIAAALRISFGITAHVDRRLLTENLRQELLGNLCHLLHHDREGGLMQVGAWAESATSKIAGGVDHRANLTIQDMRWLNIFRIYSVSVPGHLSCLFMEQALRSGAFMFFDVVSGSHKPSRAHEILMDLLSLITATQRWATPFGEGLYAFCDNFEHYKKPAKEEVLVRNRDIAKPCSDAKVLRRITDISVGLVRCLGGDEGALEKIGDWSCSVIPEETAIMEREQVTVGEVEKWIAGNMNKEYRVP